MFTLENFDKYLHEKRIIIYEQDGSVNRVAWAVLPDTPEDICEKIRSFNNQWEEEYPGMPIYLLPENPHYPHELFDKN